MLSHVNNGASAVATAAESKPSVCHALKILRLVLYEKCMES